MKPKSLDNAPEDTTAIITNEMQSEANSIIQSQLQNLVQRYQKQKEDERKKRR